MTRSLRTSGCALLFLFVPGLLNAQALPPDAILPFNDAALSPGFITPMAVDELPQGPAAIAATRHAVFLADNVNSQVLVLDRNGSAITAIPVDAPIADLRVGSEGTLTLLTADHRRIHALNPDGTPLAEFPLPSGSVRGLARAPDGKVWTVDVFGQGALAGASPTGVHAAPLGVSPRWHGTGVLRTDRTGDVLLWDWDDPAELKGRGPARVVHVKTTRRLGLVRPILVDRRGNLYILLETLSEHVPLEVTLEIRRVSPSGRSSRVAWDVHPHAPCSNSVAIDENGTVFRHESRPEGLYFWRVDSNEWTEVGR